MINPVDVNRVDVFRSSTKVGQIERTRNGSAFRYDDSLVALPGGIAFRMPYADREFVTGGVNLNPFFANLLPEGLRLRALVRKTKTSADDLLTLLIAVGSDTVGDISVRAHEGRSTDTGLSLESLDTIDFNRLRNELLRGAIQDEGVSGVQPKISAERILTSIKGSRRGASYLLKLSDPETPFLVENEHVCMKLADSCDIRAARTRIIEDVHGVSALLVERFDRLPGGREIHFEDLCQLSNRYPSDKYQISVEDALSYLAQVCTTSQVSALEFLRIYAYSYIIGNGDLHAKNIGVLGSPDGGLVRLSPAYDLLTTLPYRDLDQHRAMPFEGKRGDLYRKDVLGMARLAGLPERAVEKMLDRLTSKVMLGMQRFGEIGFTDSLLGAVGRDMFRRANRLK